MTAYFDESQEKVSKRSIAMSATLAGVLATGLMPAFALADEAAPIAEPEINTLVADAKAAFIQGSVTKAVNQNGTSISPVKVTFTKDGTNDQFVVPLEVTPIVGDPVSVVSAATANSGCGWQPGTNWSISFYKVFTGTQLSTSHTTLTSEGLSALDNTEGLGVTIKTGGGVGTLNSDHKLLVVTASKGTLGTNGKVSSGSGFSAAGTYYVQVKATGGTLQSATNGVLYKIEPASLNGATIYELQKQSTSSSADQNNFSDTTFTYKRGAWTFMSTSTFSSDQVGKLNLALDGTSLTGTNYSIAGVKWYAKGSRVTMANAPVNAGSYVAQILGKGDYASSTTMIPFEIAPLDLSNATIQDTTTQGFSGDINSLVEIDGTKLTSPLSSSVNVTMVSGPSPVPTVKGSYTYKIEPSTTYSTTPATAYAAGDVIGSATVTFDVTEDTATVKYDKTGSGATALSSSYDVNLSGDTTTPAGALKSFNTNNFEVTTTSGTVLSASQYSVTITDEAGQAVEGPALTKPGTYNVTVKVDAKANNYALGGSASTVVNVYQGAIDDAADIFVSYNGDVVSRISAPYTGSNFINKIGVTVKDTAGKALTEGTDYTVTYINSDTGEEVDSIVDAGNYTIKVESDTYYINASGSNVTIKVNPVTLTAVSDGTTITSASLIGAVRVVNAQKGEFDGVSGTTEYGWYASGNDITPELQWWNGSAWVAVPDNCYAINYKYAKTGTSPNSPVDAMKEPGVYSISLVAPESAPDPENLTVSGSTTLNASYMSADGVTWKTAGSVFYVSDQKVFTDVPADSWEAPYVYAATNLHYMNGVGGSTIFNPNAPIKRGDVTIVFYNMASTTQADVNAGGILSGTDKTLYTVNFLTPANGFDMNTVAMPFADEIKGEYWNMGILWASRAEIVNGYGPDYVDFGPANNVTREQFCKMLATYAATVGNYTAPENVDEILAEYADGDAVSDWARPYVAWAVSQTATDAQGNTVKLFGNSGALNPQANVTRAEVAKMTTMYQPQNLE